MKCGFLFYFVLAALAICGRPAMAQGTGAPQHLPEVVLTIDGARLSAEIAATGEEREIGLMYVTKMPDDEGMLFLMPAVGPGTFWMKNTLIPLSIAYLDRNGVIIDIHDMKAMDETVVKSANDKVAYALETNLHWFALNGVKPGDKVTPPPSAWGKAQP